MAGARVNVESGEGWAVLRLHSPDGLNRLGAETLESLRKEVEGVLAGKCRCIGILGEGPSFAVGADLDELKRLTPEPARVLSDAANGVIRILEGCAVPVVAGIDGFCLGGGLDLALGADWRIASAASVFSHPGADLGIITGFGGTQRLARLIGPSRARSWLFSAGRIGAREAYQAGFLQEICEPGEFTAVFQTRVKTFAELSPAWVRAAKQGLSMEGGGRRGWSLAGRLSGPGS